FQRDYRSGKPGKNRRLVSAAGPDFEDFFRSAQRERLRHQPDDVGLADRLTAWDRQSAVGIGLVAEVVGHKAVAGDVGHGAQHARIADSAIEQLLVEHAHHFALHIGRPANCEKWNDPCRDLTLLYHEPFDRSCFSERAFAVTEEHITKAARI